MIPLFLITEINEIKHFTSEAKSSNFKQDNHYWLFIQSLSEYSLSYSKPSSIISTSFSLLSIHHHKCLRFGFHRNDSYRGPRIGIYFGYPNSRTYLRQLQDINSINSPGTGFRSIHWI